MKTLVIFVGVLFCAAVVLAQGDDNCPPDDCKILPLDAPCKDEHGKPIPHTKCEPGLRCCGYFKKCVKDEHEH